jgi:putative toxin-antitoxin system antitoxin component (TIGR02293 family)
MPSARDKILRPKARTAKGRAGARMLGIDTGDTVQILRQIRDGFPYSRLAKFQKATQLPLERIARFVGIPQRTLTRRAHEGRLRPDESDRVLRASRVFELAVNLFEGDVPAARQWLEAPQPGLSGQVPLEFASTDIGTREVENLIGRLEHGVVP